MGFGASDRRDGRGRRAGARSAGRGRAVAAAAFGSLAAGVALGALGTVAALGVLAGAWVPETANPAVSPARALVDDGRAFGPGGSSRFTVTVDPDNTGVRLIRRLDAGIGMQRATITVNGTPAGAWQPLHTEHVYRWKDQSVDIPPSLSAGKHSLTIVNTFVSSDQDFNEFLYVVQHQVNGVWSTADTLDVGPGHPASEAAHGYRIIGPETFTGAQTFSYPPSTPSITTDGGDRRGI
ncbi:hypothetical protein [Nonomuraea candida]|uniref:hypothetical protein n=1 Tax=Nonomuraea candida TaxID=359159 RepID=UPI0005B8F3CA|nr:hypothetical protein [Nonomuraea candida]